ncbi:putative secreted protein (Por secretion system target) [Gillisia mitskevichiae]|uniref:Putative secreted protein (Por secretion system target) n=1 Tax=Gillisia mitskevichiae TaxID=270921 RepID=A0A495P232_9FLAO|nr:T9SS type A sorting domain-containing protein [Gillisia mitskevichiae]RKS43448.1 putative secreted protein (Por secretion system target) [Gillisia mitskevichiae]
MGKKLLFLILILFAYLFPASGMAQECPSSISISSNLGTTICENTNVTFTASPNGGTSLSFEWFVNSSSSGTGLSFSSNTLSNSDKIKVVAKSTDNPLCSTTSNVLTITVNAIRVPSVSISSTANTICPGDNVKFTASPVNGGTSPNYQWKIGSAIQSGNSNTFSTTALTDGQSVTVQLTSNATCAAPTTAISDPIVIAVQPGTPSIPSAIQGEASVCPGVSSLVYSVPAVTNATEYIWSLPNGWSGTSTTNTISVTSGATGTGTITVKAKNSCGTSAAQSLPITIKAGTPTTPIAITGDTQVCPGISKTYSVAAVAGAVEYEWTLPNGWNGSSITNSINVTTGTTGNGNITVKAKNDCGTSPAKILAVSVKPGTPAVPTTISGTANICPGTTNTYSIAAVPNATSYEWTLPNGWTGNSTSTSINAISNSSGGDIKVKAINDCGISAVQTLTVTMKAGTPATPSIISGSNTVCPNTSETYSVTNNTNATEYIWTLPNGWTGTSTTSSISVTTAVSGSGNIKVKAKNDCGTSAEATIAVSIKAPAPIMNGTISGPATVCSGSSGLTYTIPAIANAATYTWSLPTGWSGNSTTNSITATAGTSGNISVKAINSCGESGPSTNFAVSATSGVPSTPGVITSSLGNNKNICPPATAITFSLPTAVAGATSYSWTLPSSGWEIISGAGTRNITVKVTSAAASGAQQVSVQAINICGITSSTYTGIEVSNHIVTNAGADITVCKTTNLAPITFDASVVFGNSKFDPTFQSSGSGSFPGPAPKNESGNFTYQYKPTLADYNLGQVTITMTVPRPNGNNTNCGTGNGNNGVDDVVIFFKPDPTASIAGTSTICTGNATDITFTGTPNSIITYKKNGGADQTIAVGSSGNATLNTGALTANTTYSLVSVKHAAAPDCSIQITGSAIVTITPKPTATISYANSPYNKCITTVQPVTLNGTGAFQGGKYSSTTGLTINQNSGAITPSSSTAGTYTVTYETLASGGCEKVSTTSQVIIEDIPTISLSYSGTPFCSDDTSSPLPTLGGTGAYEGGNYSAENGLDINGNSGAINIPNSSPGTYNVIYSITPANGCTPITQSASVVITEKPQPSINYLSTEFCKSETDSKAVTLTQTGTAIITGGTYSSSPSGLNINSSTGAINPSMSTAGDYTIKYTLNTGNGCQSVFTETTLSITETPSAEINYAGPFCQSNSTPQQVTFSNTIGAYEGGVFSGTAGLSINPSTGAITPSTSQSGEHTITYAFVASGGCESTEINTIVIITSAPTATVSYNGPFCTSQSSPQAAIFDNTAGAYQNGTFSGTNGLSIDSNGNIDPSSSIPGEHIVTYTIPATNGCEENEMTAEIEILEQVIITTQPSNVGICSTLSAEFEVVASGDNLTYQWFKDGIEISGKTSSLLSFNNATSTNAGDYYVVVSGTSPCSPITSETVTLNVDEEIIIIKPAEDETFCENDVTEITFEFIAHANGAPLTFEWIKDNNTINAGGNYTMITTGPTGPTGEYNGKLTISNLTTSDNGAYAVKIKGPDYFTCQDATSKSFTLSIKDQPEPPLTADLTYCQGDIASSLTAIGTSLKWYETETGDDLISGTPTPITSDVGYTSYWVSQTPSECESLREELVVEVKARPAIPSTTTNLTFCLNEVVNTPLEAIGESGNTINWYNTENSVTPLSTAPTPNTSTDVTTNYWVSQTQGNCESDRVQVSITINPLPILTASTNITTICAGSPATLTASGASTYLWTVDGEPIQPAAESTKASPQVSPTETTTYLVTGTSDKGCTSTTTVTIQVDKQTIAPTITPSATSVCITNNTGSLSIAGTVYEGTIQRWESSVDGGTTWNIINNITETLTFTNLNQTTKYRVAVKSGICAELLSAPVEIKVDPVPVGGNLLFTKNNERIYLSCVSPTSSSGLSNISISGHSGTIVAWKYRKISASTWTTIQTSGTSITASQIYALGLNESMVFQVEISSGSCTPNALSQTAILSVIPSDIAPKPVKVEPAVVCKGDIVTLSSSTGYGETFGEFDGGAFGNAAIDQSNNPWRFKDKGVIVNFESSANNTKPNRWNRTQRHDFITANLTSPYSTTLKEWNSINPGQEHFAIVSGNNSTTMETPVFALSGLDQGILTFDQAYNLTPGATIKVQISTDGGNTYNAVLFQKVGVSGSGNYDRFSQGTVGINKMALDLGQYLGQNNLRIRFSFDGTRDGDVWAVDNVIVPDGPQDVTLEWRDYSDPAFPEGIFIGNDNSEEWEPKLIGWNKFEVKTAIILDSNGQNCSSIENSKTIRVFVFDRYTTTITSIAGTCGNYFAELNAITTGAFGGNIGSFPTADGYIGEWEIKKAGVIADPATYTLTNVVANSSLTPKNNPNVLFEATISGDFEMVWKLISTSIYPNDYFDETLRGQVVQNTGCLPVFTPTPIQLKDCTTLDFDGVDDYVDLGTSFTGSYSIEAWVRPEAANGTIISGPNFDISLVSGNVKFNSKTFSAALTPNSRWYHIAATSAGELYVDGILIDNGAGVGGGFAKTIIGAKWNASSKKAEDYFSGWIEEVRIWKKELSIEQIQFMMNQHLQNAANMGKEIPMPVPGSLTYSDLEGYYPLISKIPDLNNLETFEAALMPANGLTPDISLSNIVPGRLYNMTTDQQNTAPLPYISANDGLWSNINTWLRPNVWDAPNSIGVKTSIRIDWNIARINHNIESGDRDITLLGLKSETQNKLLEISGPGNKDENNSGQLLRVTHYLKLDGNIDLVGESQLIQNEGSLLEEASAGYLERDQQGTLSSFNYNYWTAPVSIQGAANNSGFTVRNIMWDGTDAKNPKAINYKPSYPAADGAKTNPITKSDYWIYKFANKLADDYDSWQHIGSTGFLKTGEGHTMKGVSGVGGTAAIKLKQNYVYRGKPNNGTITLHIDKEKNYLVGNPYPSAIDANEFIYDNLNSVNVVGARNNKNVFDGTLYFWDHFSGATHILREYIGGYAVLNLTGGAPAIATDDRINSTAGVSTKSPERYIPVSQGFFVNTGTEENISGGVPFTLDGGEITFKNGQRVFSRESSGNSIFLRPENITKTRKDEVKNTGSRIRISFKSPKGYLRQLLVGTNAYATNGFDLGYDAPMIEYNSEDMYWLQAGNFLVIQGVPDFGKDQILPIGVRIEKAGEFTIKIDTLENINDDHTIYLRDITLDTIHDIRSKPYLATAEPGEITDRFELIFFKEQAQVPIEEPIIIEDITDLGLLHSYLENEMMVLNPQELSISAIYLFDLNGKLLHVFKDTPSEKEIILRVGNFSEGIYILKMHTVKEIITRKIIIKNK